MSGDVLGILSTKSQLFEYNKEKSLTETRNRIESIITQLKKIEEDLLKEIESKFDNNIYAVAFSYISNEMSAINLKRAENISKIPVPDPIYPRNEELKTTFNLIQELMNTTKPVPKELIANTDQANSLTLMWSKTPEATGYRVEMKKPNESSFREIYQGANTMTTINGLTKEEKHSLRVCAVYGCEMSGWSDVIKVKPWILHPPKNIKAASETSDSIKVMWDEVENMSQVSFCYQVFIREKNNQSMTKSFISNVPLIDEKGFIPGKEYVVCVRTICGDKYSKWSNVALVATRPLKCPIGHNLNPYDLKVEIANGRLSWGVTCDICKKMPPSGVLCGCRICNFDICSECMNNRIHLQRKECPKGHSLTSMTLSQIFNYCPQYSSQSLSCDICKNPNINSASHPPNYPVLHCLTCNHDVCNECAQAYGSGTH